MFREALRPAWVEVSLKNLEYNIKNILGKIGPGKECIGVVKADGYGHGAVEVGKILLANGVTTLAVATLREAISLREAGFSCPIVHLGLVPTMYGHILLDYDLTPVTASLENASALSDLAKAKGKILHGFVAVDTGMGRIGLLPNDDSVLEIQKINQLSNYKLKGIFSHFATSDEKDKTYANLQIDKYINFCECLEKSGVEIAVRTFANSAAIMELPHSHYHAVRPGIILYGCYPSGEVNPEFLSIKPVMSVKANIVQLKSVSTGSSISYGRRFTTERQSLIGTLTLGYADGYPRPLNGQGRVIVKGCYAPVVGNICMDQCMIDVTEVPYVKEGDEVILMGSDGKLSITAEEIAEKTGTISYEILCAFGQRLPKVYI